MADRPGEAEAIRDVLGSYDEQFDGSDLANRAKNALAALDRLMARLSEAERRNALVDELGTVASLTKALQAAEARLSEAERDLAQECEWHHRAELGWADERMRADAAEARLSDYEQALRAIDKLADFTPYDDDLGHAAAAAYEHAASFARDALSGSTEIPPEDLDWDNAEVHGRETEGNEE